MDSHTVYTREGYFERIGKSIRGVVVGAVLFIVSFPLLFWNEGRAVKTARMLAEGAKVSINVESGAVSPGNEGKLIHFTGNAAGSPLADPLLGVKQDAIHLQRKVEMYQFDEKKETETKKDAIGGGTNTRTTYSYPNVWSEKVIDSSKFNDSRGHNNPDHMRISAHTEDAKTVTVGAFTIPTFLVAEINNYSAVPLNKDSISQISDADVKADTVLDDQRFYISGVPGDKPNPATPRVGDIRITMNAVPPGPISVVAKQVGSTVEKYSTSNGQALALLSVGTKSSAEMFTEAQSANVTMTWILRLVGFVLMLIGVFMFLAPLKVLADVIGILGDIVGMGLGLAAFLVALVFSSLTIAVAWLFYRPFLGIGLMAVAAIGAFLFFRSSRNARAARATPPAVPA